MSNFHSHSLTYTKLFALRSPERRHLPKARRGVALSFAKERDHRALSLFHYDPFIPAGQTGGAAPYRL